MALAMSATLALCAPALATPASQPDLGFPVVNGSVSAIAVSGSTAYLGGDFTRIGRASGGLASSRLGSRPRTERRISVSRDAVDDGPFS